MRKQTKLVAVLSAAALLAIGASMTSFAAGWTQEDGTWVYLDRDGDRVTEDWRKSGSNYYWLDEDGLMATDMLVEDDDEHFYVDANGVRLTNQWVSVENVEDEDVDGKAVDTLWYYLGSSGRAYRANGSNTFKISMINGKKYFFDADGHMVSGWVNDGNDTYYLGDENEGWAYTGWQYLEIDENIEAEDYNDDEAWFYFQGSGKAHKNARKYIGGKYYAFDRNGVMITDWQTATVTDAAGNVIQRATVDRVDNAEDIGLEVNQGTFYDLDEGGQGSGWVYTYAGKDESGDQKWFYMVAGDKNSIFNANGKDGLGSSIQKYTDGNIYDSTKSNVAARIIKGKTYLFDSNGQMLTGVFRFVTSVQRGNSSPLVPGIYYFNKNGGSVEGQMESGKATITYDGDTYNYYFRDGGNAYTLEVRSGVAYDGLGAAIKATDGNSYAVKNIRDINMPQTVLADGSLVNASSPRLKINGTTTYTNGTIVVSSSGRIKSNGTVTIDGVKYVVKNYVVVKAYDKDDKDERDIPALYDTAR